MSRSTRELFHGAANILALVTAGKCTSEQIGCMLEEDFADWTTEEIDQVAWLIPNLALWGAEQAEDTLDRVATAIEEQSEHASEMVFAAFRARREIRRRQRARDAALSEQLANLSTDVVN
jgi:hypothetical protein